MPNGIGEREHARRLLSDPLLNSLIFLDRGYPAFWFFKLIRSENVEFCARICSKWKIVRRFIQPGKKEKIFKVKPTPASAKYCKELGLDIKPIKLRLICIVLDTGEIEVLITSLINKQTYAMDIFYELYHERWPVEKDYKIMKCRMKMEAFTGQSVLLIY